jgi:geranyl-CoA carboxylase alpha subunit
MTAIRTLLIANRGEIAVRIARAAKARGIKTVAVYSDADAGAMHVRRADAAIRIGPAESAASYLNGAAVIAAARRAGADAVHPGYGFLSERADFAQACADAGLLFIGPPAAAIAAMGDKAAAKRRMAGAGVPTIPGYEGEDQSDRRLAEEARRIGFPVMLKASAGGGGRGQRFVGAPQALAEAIASARRESVSAFGDARLIVEKAILGARHVEVQVAADSHGGCVHLGERDCSLQRRRQKVIEEAPSPAVSPELRRRMGEAAVEAARAVGYVNVGTVEFLLEPETQTFYFLEMNTRLQVEHPVTELTMGVDLVGMQFDIAEGRPLAVAADRVGDGWAIEARLYAEDPADGFLPQAGRVARLRLPSGVRVDSGIEEGDVVSPHYDPLLAKIIAHGRTRDEARRSLAAALRETVILGVISNRDFLVALLEDEAFAEGAAATDYIEANLPRLARRAAPGVMRALAAAALVEAPFGGLLTGWNSRGSASFPLRLSDQFGATIAAEASLVGRRLTVRDGETRCEIEILSCAGGEIRYVFEGAIRTAHFSREGDVVDIDAEGAAQRFLDLALAPAGEGATGADSVRAPMAGAVTSVAVAPGDRVIRGQTVATIEAMKMEHHLKAPRDGIVAEVRMKPGDQAAIRAVVVALAEAER